MEPSLDPGGRLAPGRRRLTPESITSDVESRAFAGLPAGITSPKALLEAMKRARAPLGFSAAVVELIDHLFSYTELQDWTAPSRPVVWPSNRLLADQLGITVWAVQKRIRAAVELGLVVMRDAPNGQRRGRRDPQGRMVVVDTFGFDLAPLALRYQDFVAAAAAHVERFRVRQAIRRQGYLHKGGLLQAFEAVLIAGRWSTLWDSRKSDADALFAGLDRSEDAEHLGAIVERLAELKRIAESDITGWSDTAMEEDRAMGRTVSTPKNSTDRPSLKPSTGSSAQRDRGSRPSPIPSASPSPLPGPVPVEERLAVDVVIATVPEIAEFMPKVFPNWDDLVEVAAGLASHYEISRRNWGRACEVLGRHGAALAFAVMVHHHARGLVSSPGGYFHAMIERGQVGQLDLIRSYHGMRSRMAKDH